MSPEASTDAPGVVDTTPEVADPATYEAMQAAEADEATEAEKPVDEKADEKVVEPDPFDEIVDLDEPVEVAEEEADEAEGEEEGDEEDTDEDAVEMRSFDFGGNKLEVPKDAVPPELADRIEEFSKGIWTDYTQGKQAQAETAKTLEARETAVAKMTSLNGEALQTYSLGLQLRQDIEQLSQVDLQSMWQSDPDQARRISDGLAAKQVQFQGIVSLVGQQETALDEAAQEEISRRTVEGVKTLDTRFKNFSTEKAPEVVKYAVSKGMTQEQAEQWQVNPLMTEMAYKSMLYDRMQSKAKKPTNTPSQTTPVKPMKATGKASSNSNDPDKMSMAQLSKHLGTG
jgi:hypothetical protein